MGMSASQARLLYITTKMNHLSLEGQNVSNAKIRLSMDSEKIQEKYTNALNSTNLFVNNNIFTASGSTSTTEAISLEALAAQDLLVYNGNTVLGYKYEEVDTGRTEKKIIGYEPDYNNPIYGTKEETSTFRSPSANADKVGTEDLSTMKSLVDNLKTQYNFSDDDIRTVSYTTQIGGEEQTINAIAISSIDGFVGVLQELLNNNVDAKSQNYVLDFPKGTVIDFSQILPTNDWPGISRFQGVFDGNGTTIANIGGTQGFFQDLYGTVKNLNIDNINISAETDIIGGLAGYVADAGCIENCNVTNANITCLLQNKSYDEGYTSQRASIGGLVGLSNGDIKNSSAQGTINIPNADDSFGYIGGFVGANANPQKGECSIENCYSDVDIILSNNTNYSNSINGFIGDDSLEATIKNCLSLGSIKTAGGSPINGTDLANWGPAIESDVENLIALDTRNNNNVLYWGNATSPNWSNGTSNIPSNLGENWIMPGGEGYNEQTQDTAKANNIPVLNLKTLQEEALAKEETKIVQDPDNITGYMNDLTKPIYDEVPIKEIQLVKDPDFAGMSSAELEKGLREGLYTLVQKAKENSTQSIRINGTDYELVSWQTCTDITDKQDETKLALAEAEYEKGMNAIQAKDKEYEIQQKKIDTEYKALQTEEESIKTILSKNVERSFKTFG